VLPDATPAAK
jgi:hypothetical protein